MSPGLGSNGADPANTSARLSANPKAFVRTPYTEDKP